MTSLVERIKDAFAAVPYPGDSLITHCPYGCTECKKTTEYFKGRNWEGHSKADLREHHTALALFAPEAFQYFLPVFMIASLEPPYEKSDPIPDSIRFYFEYSQHALGHLVFKVSKLSPAQRNTIIDYLVFMEAKGAGSSEEAIGMLCEESAYA